MMNRKTDRHSSVKDMEATIVSYMDVKRSSGQSNTPDKSFSFLLLTDLHHAQRTRDMTIRVEHEPHGNDDPTRKTSVVNVKWKKEKRLT
jgi:hypothetical protein